MGVKVGLPGQPLRLKVSKTMVLKVESLVSGLRLDEKENVDTIE
jgi:hypothetical protein